METAKKQLFRLSHVQGVLLTIVLSFVMLNLQFGKVLYQVSDIYFAAGGDGFRSYYAAQYHVKYDSSYLSTKAMNYPYRESVFYSDQQPLISETLKFISNNIVDVAHLTPLTYNLAMLFSFLAASLILYLLFQKLRLPVWYSIIAAVLITFLSPQCDRMLGHFSLSYIIVIPLILLLFLDLYNRVSYKRSLLIGLTTLFFGLTHGYYLAFSGVVILFFWLHSILINKEQFGKLKIVVPHIFVQLILPFIIMTLLIEQGADAQNRGTHPWGFLVYRSYPESIFLPLGKPYASFLQHIELFKRVQWEGVAYIGTAALAGFIAILINGGKSLFRMKIRKSFSITQHHLLNTFFWASLVLLIYSMGIPFIFDLEWLLNFIGPLRQMRSIGRFAWLFFYTINIIVIYNLWNWQPHQNYKQAKKYIIVAVFLLMAFDAWHNSKSQQNYMGNTIAELSDRSNVTEQNNWVQLIDRDNYQAIIPVPYFHSGSENVWIDGAGGIKKLAYIVSLKTGLPITASAMGRTSIDQTFDNIQMHYAPYRKLNILKDLPSRKDFLLLVAKNCELNEAGQNLVDMAKQNNMIYENKHFFLYSIKVEQLENITHGLFEKVADEIESDSLYQHQNVLTTDSLENFVYQNFYGNLSNNAYMGVDAFEGNTTANNHIFDGCIPNGDTTRNYVLSFWFGGIRRDLAVRTRAVISFADTTGNTYFWELHDLWRKMKLIDNDWMLFEFNFKLRHPNDKISISLSNSEMGNKKLYVDELLIRPVDNNIYVRLAEFLGKNNRYFKIKQ